jgi:hypothetical protein
VGLVNLGRHDKDGRMKPCIFIHTNEKQIVGALVSKYSFERFASDAAAFDVRLIHTKDYPFLTAHEGRFYLRDGLKREWMNDDLQSFTVLRFMPPEIMGYQGRSIVVDPDVFAVADVMPLLARDMQGKAILARKRTGSKSRVYASSVMLLDNAKLKHWQVEKNFEEMFSFKRDYMDWITLQLDPPDSIGPLEIYWNDFDRLTPETRLIHNTQRMTQPWKTGLKVDFRPAEKAGSLNPRNLLRRARRALFGEYGLLGTYKKHPDANQERLFFALLRECVENGIVTKDKLDEQMRLNHVRHDAFEVLARTPTLSERPLFAS